MFKVYHLWKEKNEWISPGFFFTHRLKPKKKFAELWNAVDSSFVFPCICDKNHNGWPVGLVSQIKIIQLNKH